jgi:hypothetical protein
VGYPAHDPAPRPDSNGIQTNGTEIANISQEKRLLAVNFNSTRRADDTINTLKNCPAKQKPFLFNYFCYNLMMLFEKDRNEQQQEI